MADGRGREQWNHTSALMALIWNTSRTSKDDPEKEAADFNPYALRDRADAAAGAAGAAGASGGAGGKKQSITVLKHLFPKRAKKPQTKAAGKPPAERVNVGGPRGAAGTALSGSLKPSSVHKSPPR